LPPFTHKGVSVESLFHSFHIPALDGVERLATGSAAALSLGKDFGLGTEQKA